MLRGSRGECSEEEDLLGTMTAAATGVPCAGVLVLMELSRADAALLREARRLAEAWNAPIHLFCVGTDPRRTGGMEFELTDWVTHAREENLRARAHLAHLARRLARKGFTVRTTFAEGRPREAVRALLRAPTPAAVVVHGRPRAEHRHALDHGIRRVLLAAGGWLVVVPAG